MLSKMQMDEDKQKPPDETKTSAPGTSAGEPPEQKQSAQQQESQEIIENPKQLFYNWLFHEVLKDLKPLVHAYFHAKAKYDLYALIDRIVSLVLLVGILVGLIAVYIWLVANHPDQADKYVMVILAFLAGGGIATLLRPLSATRLFRGTDKNEDS